MMINWENYQAWRNQSWYNAYLNQEDNNKSFMSFFESAELYKYSANL